MKKYLFGALALPLLFACSSEDFTEQEAINNDPFAGIQKVDATFTMDEGPITRMDKGSWRPEEGDLWGFAWLGDGTKIVPSDEGIAYQNHNLIQTSGIFQPQTSIYVGKYYLYRPYDKTTVSPQAINFKSLEEQTLAEGYESAKQPWKDLAKTAINISPKWTDVTVGGEDIDLDGKMWNKAGIKESYKLYPAVFSNQTGLDLSYVNNNVPFDGQTITGATDINYTYPTGSTVGAADIYDGTVQLAGAAKSFTYAPKSEPTSTYSETYWADKSNLGTGNGFTHADGAITLKAADEENGVSTGKNGNKQWFWFNSLPVTLGDATLDTKVTTILNTSYGKVTVDPKLSECAYVFDYFDNATGGFDPEESNEWIQLVAGSTDDNTTTPKKWGFDGHKTFINHYGNHKGKYALTIDFKDAKMTDMHVKNDAHLQKLLKFYIASGKDEGVTLNLDGASASDKTFKLSKISIALLQTINAAGHNVKVQPCTSHNNPVKIIITQDGQTAENGLADNTEVPALSDVFATATPVYLAAKNSDGTAISWTWAGGTDAKTALKIDDKVSSITNEGTLTVNASNVELSETAATLANAKGATMTFNEVTTVKNALTNLGTINVGSDTKAAELRAYGVEIKNDATDASDKAQKGLINNYGVVGVTAGTSGKFNNYGIIEMKKDDAMTLLTSNEIGTKPFGVAFGASNKMGTVVLPEGKPYAIVSVSNKAENGFIKYNWTADTYTHDTGNVKYNTIVVNKNITFTGDPAVNPATEIQYIEFNGTKTQVVNPGAAGEKGLLTELKGIIVNENQSIVIEKNNTINCSVSSWVAPGATVYRGGYFNGYSYTSIFGTWSHEQIVTF